MKTPLIPLLALGIASCAPKAEIVDAPQPRPSTSSQVKTPEPTRIKTPPNDGLRINEDDILALPSDDQLRSRNKSTTNAEAPIIIRPPSE